MSIPDMVGVDPDSWSEDEIARQEELWNEREAILFPDGIAEYLVKYNRVHGRDGRFSSGGGLTGELQHHVEGGDGSRDHPFKTKDVDTAIALLGQGHHVRLHQPDEVATMVDKLAAIGQDAKAKGEKAPTYDLAKVSVKGTNLFATQSKHVPRNMMPQLSGKATPGSWADKHLPKNDKGEVNLGNEYEKMLRNRGISVTETTVPASHLRASQNQLNGVKVGGMTKAIEAGTLPAGAIYVTRDNYVIDGHHRWAANVAAGLKGHADIDMPVKVVDEDILQTLAISNNFAVSHGIPKAGVDKFNRAHGRDGRFSSGGSAAPMTGPGKPPAPISGRDVAEFTDHQVKLHGGFTVQRSTGKAPSSGYCVAVAPKKGLVLDADHPDPAKVRSWVKANESEFAKPDRYMGGWKDTAENKVALDIVAVLPANRAGKREAIRLGKKNDQVAIYSLHEDKEISTGGTGGYKKADKPTMALLNPDATDDEITAWLLAIV